MVPKKYWENYFRNLQITYEGEITDIIENFKQDPREMKTRLKYKEIN